MASRLDFSQIRSLYVGTSSSTQVDTNNLIVAGNVGIGTTAPGAKLEVVAGNTTSISVRSGNSGQYSILSVGRTSSDIIMASAASSGQFWTGSVAGDGWVGSTNGTLSLGNDTTGVANLTIKSGNVGIGTTSPAVRLDVVGANSAEGQLYVGNTNVEYSAGINFTTSGTNRGFVGWRHTYSTAPFNLTGIHLFNTDNSNIVFGTNNLVRAVIDTNGNVGIGTTSPNNKLVVSGSFRTILEGTYNQGILNEYVSAYVTRTKFGRPDTVSNLELYYDIQGSEEARITRNYTSAKLKFDRGATTDMIIDGSGNVGIGTTSPTDKLQVVASTYNGITITTPDVATLKMRSSGGGTTNWGFATTNLAASDFGIYESNSAGGDPINAGTTRLYFKTGGNVGIGTTSPLGPLEVYRSNTGGLGGHIIVNNNGSAVGNETALMFGDGGINAIRAAISSTTEGAPYAGDIKFKTGISAYASLSTQMIIKGNGNVGIGTTSPQVELHVKGNNGWGEVRVEGQTFASGHGASLEFYSEGTALADIYASTDKHLYFRTNGTTERMRITAGGNVGIGTTSPFSKLQVGGNTFGGANGMYADNRVGISNHGNLTGLMLASTYNDATYPEYGLVFVQGPNTSSYNVWSISPDGPAKGSGLHFIYQANSTNIHNQTPAVSFIGSTGNVGIGTTAPTQKLEVVGSAAGDFPGIALTNTNTGGSSDAVTAIFRLTRSDGTTYSAPAIRFVKEQAWTTTASTIDAALTFSTTLNEGTTERMRITSDGNVGIGTTAPTAKLTIGANTVVQSTNGIALGIGQASLEFVHSTFNNGFGSKFYSVDSGGGVTSLRLAVRADSTTWVDAMTVIAGTTGGGNVGIGTTSPSQKLHVASSGNEGIFMEGTSNGGHWFDFKSANSNLWSMGAQPGLMGWYNRTDSTYKMVITDGGNVGIGTTAPTEKLQVSGSLKLDDGNADGPQLKLASSGYSDWNIDNFSGSLRAYYGSTEYTRLTSSGNFGIGVTPSYKLDVAGDTRITSGSLGVGVAPNATDGRIDASNDIVAYQTSDRRLKENITPIVNAIDKVKSLTGVEFDWKEETKHVHGYEGHDTGIIAQEVQAVMPTAVRTNDSGYLSVRYEKLIGLLVEANKELAARVEELEAKLK